MYKVSLFLLLVSFLLGRSPNAQTVGVIHSQANMEAGYTLFAPTVNNFTYLIDECGHKINEWEADKTPGMIAKLDQNGTLFYAGRTNSPEFSGGGIGGALLAYDWNNNEKHSINLADLDFHQHHDFEILPNGNILVLGWEFLSQEYLQSIGRAISNNSGLWSESVREIKLLNKTDYEIVWEWRVIDHIVQDIDPQLPNFGIIEENPHKININYTNGQSPNTKDWLHCNSLDYNPELDQIIINCRNFAEFWIIDHSTTLEEAATGEGGITGMGGDLLYRWGNPESYNSGTETDQVFFGQHDAHWIPEGLPNAGKIRVFNNGIGRPEGSYSTIETIDPPIQGFIYTKSTQEAFGPIESDILYGTNEGSQFFYSQRISGSQQLPNGNVLICSGTRGYFFEINEEKEIVWSYVNPSAIGITTQGDPAPTGANSVFQAIKYPVDFPGFQGKDLTPGEKIELEPIDNCVITANEEIFKENISIFFDHAHREIVLQNPDKLDISISLYDVQGRFLLDISSQRQSVFQISSPYLISGMYFVQLKSENKLLQTVKIPVVYE